MIEQEMLAIVEVLKEYRNFLFSSTNIAIFTGHKNLLSNSTVNDISLETKNQEFWTILNYIKGHKNNDIDALSCFPISNKMADSFNRGESNDMKSTHGLKLVLGKPLATALDDFRTLKTVVPSN